MTYIHKSTLTRCATLEAARRHHAAYTASQSPIGAGISLDPSDPPLPSLLADAGYYAFDEPVYDPDTHRSGDYIWNDEEKTATVEVRPLTTEELRARVPDVVTMRQARVYLHRAGMLDTITAQVEALGGEAQITWEYSQEVQRSNPLVAAMGFTDEQLDTMFKEASQL